MATIRDTISGSLRLIGVLASGENPTSSQQADALQVLIELVDAWRNENLMLNATLREEFSFVGGQSLYTIGTGGDFNTTRPDEIEAVMMKTASGPSIEIPVRMLSAVEYAEISNKALSSSLSTQVFISGAAPLNQMTFWPVPSGGKVVIYSKKTIGTFTTADDAVTLAPGYAKALRYNLALELCPEYGRAATAEIIQGAQSSKEEIKRRNSKPVYTTPDLGLPIRNRTFNFIKGS